MRNFKIIIFINTIISIVCLYLFFLDGGGLNYGGVLLLAIPIAGYYFVSTKKVTNTYCNYYSIYTLYYIRNFKVK